MNSHATFFSIPLYLQFWESCCRPRAVRLRLQIVLVAELPRRLPRLSHHHHRMETGIVAACRATNHIDDEFLTLVLLAAQGFELEGRFIKFLNTYLSLGDTCRSLLGATIDAVNGINHLFHSNRLLSSRESDLLIG